MVQDIQDQIDFLKSGLNRMELRQERFDGTLASTNETLKRIDIHLAEIAKDLKLYIPRVNENAMWIEFVKKAVFFVAISVVCAGLGRIVWGMVDAGLRSG